MIFDSAPHLLVVDDDRRLRELIGRYLIEQGARVTHAASAAQARVLLDFFIFDLILLDVMMPGEDGFSLARALQEAGLQTPVLFLTARGDAPDRVQGLELGAEDYLAKPFDPKELVLRIANILRRQGTLEPPLLNAKGGYGYDVASAALIIPEGAQISEREKGLLSALFERAGQPLSRAELADRFRVDDRTLDVQIGRLRRKLPEGMIETVRGVGYKISLLT